MTLTPTQLQATQVNPPHSEEKRKRNQLKAVVTHGMTYEKFYGKWMGMKKRCKTNTKISYPNYGGRGITVCDRWATFQNFMDDMHESYKRHIEIHGEGNTQLDRIDNDGNYEPENCRWVTRSINQMNKRNSRKITINGVTKNLFEWAREKGVSSATLSYRIKHNWPEELLFNPPYKRC